MTEISEDRLSVGPHGFLVRIISLATDTLYTEESFNCSLYSVFYVDL